MRRLEGQWRPIPGMVWSVLVWAAQLDSHMPTMTPRMLRALRDERIFEIVWPDERVDRLTFYELRCGCPCAVCVDEITGKALLRRESVPSDVHAAGVAYVGNYALRFDWSDGHSTGIYTWDRLRSLGDPA
jgi:DUF971 family protein